jgi:tricorn protease interacting factor F2/3
MRFGAVTPHEVSHFWFGDLVSPKEWKDIWLNESFASYFTYAITDYCFPEWRIWNLFYERYYITALERDGLIETYPIELPAKSMDVIGRGKIKILYDKGASVLLMFQEYIRESNFKKGIAHFLNNFKFSNADSNQYWEAFQEATKFPVKKFAKSWIFQSGYPLVKVLRRENELILTQECFTYLPHDSEKLWLIPITISLYFNNGEKQKIDVVFEEKTKTISIPPETRAFKINTEQKAFCRVMYEKNDLKELSLLIRDKKLSSLDRFGVENDLYAFVVKGMNALEDYLRFLEESFEFEDEYVPLFSICNNLLHAYSVVDSKRNAIEDTGKLIFRRYFEKFGFQPNDDEEISVSALRYMILWTACSLGYQDVINFGINEFQNLLEGKKVHQDILESVLRIGAAFSNNALEYIYNKILALDTPEIEQDYMLEALGCFREKKHILNALNFILEHVPQQSQYIAFEIMGKNAYAIEPLGEWLLDNHKKLEKLPKSAYERAIEYLVPIGSLNKKSEIKQLLEERMKKTMIGRGTLKIALETLEINSRLKNRY